MDTIQNNYQNLVTQITQICKKNGRNPDGITIITVTKTRPIEVLQSVVSLGHNHIGENRVQEIVHKIPMLKGNKTVHMIGHLQSNKVAKIIPYVDWIQSIDSVKLLEKVDHYCQVNEKKVDILIQVNTSGEKTKTGCQKDKAFNLVEKAMGCECVNFRGFMTIGPLVRDEKQIRLSFSTLRKLGEQCRDLSKKPIELSMGMSDDFHIAIEEGSTMIRLGTRILGKREMI